MWLLTLITFVNRAGTMVVPFLSLYLTKDMGLTLEQVGWIMICFGAGSVVGSWIGGRLTDRIGHYDVMVGTLTASGIAFILLQFVKGFLPFCAGIFLLMVLADGFRPAMFVAIRSYAKPEDRTRAVTLIRLAINLGFSFGPAIGGFIIATWSYGGLFWVDGLTCLAAVTLMGAGLPRRRGPVEGSGASVPAQRSPYRDGPYLFFLSTVVVIGVAFLQYFSTVPLYYRDVHGLSESYIGLLLGFNGLLIFLVEMPLIRYCEARRHGLHGLLRASTALFAIGFALFNVSMANAVLWIGMAFTTVGEMLNFPFMNRFANERADGRNAGAYLGAFTIAWSVAQIIAHALGLNMVDRFGYSATWYAFTVLLVVAMGMLWMLERMVQREAGTAR